MDPMLILMSVCAFGALIFLGILLALPVAVAVVRHRGPVVTVLERTMYLSFALPDLVGAIALAYLASHWLHFLYGSFALLVLGAYATGFLAAIWDFEADEDEPKPAQDRTSKN